MTNPLKTLRNSIYSILNIFVLAASLNIFLQKLMQKLTVHPTSLWLKVINGAQYVALTYSRMSF